MMARAKGINDMKTKGTLTEEIKNMLQSRRLQLGWSFTRMAEFFEIEVSTYRNWENGKTTYIQSDRQQRLVQSFIVGEAIEAGSGQGQEALDNCLALVSRIYTLLSADQELLNGYSRALKGSLSQIMMRYVEGEPFPISN